jgi:type 1 fimbriae regulatory protein FimB
MAIKSIPHVVELSKLSKPAVAISLVDKKFPRSRSKRGQMTFLTPEETLAVLRAARGRLIRDWAMILLAYRHGLRASEVCGLKLSDVDLKSGSISIRRLKGSLQTVQPLYPHRGQPLLDEMSALRAWLRERQTDGSDFLFTSQKGGKRPNAIFPRVPNRCGRCRPASGEATPSCPQALVGVASGRWKREFGSYSSGSRTSLDKLYYAVCRHERRSGC